MRPIRNETKKKIGFAADELPGHYYRGGVGKSEKGEGWPVGNFENQFRTLGISEWIFLDFPVPRSGFRPYLTLRCRLQSPRPMIMQPFIHCMCEIAAL